MLYPSPSKAGEAFSGGAASGSGQKGGAASVSGQKGGAASGSAKKASPATPSKLTTPVRLFAYDAPGASKSWSDAAETLLTRFLVDADVLDMPPNDMSSESFQKVYDLYCEERKKVPAGSVTLPARTLQEITAQSKFIVQILEEGRAPPDHAVPGAQCALSSFFRWLAAEPLARPRSPRGAVQTLGVLRWLASEPLARPRSPRGAVRTLSFF